MKTRTVDVTLGGQKRTLRFDLGAAEDFEKATTYTLEDGTVIRGSTLEGLTPRSAHEFTALVWACLKADAEYRTEDLHQPTPTPTRRQVRQWVAEEGAMERLYAELMELLAANSPEPRESDGGDEGDEGPPDPPTAEAGSSEPTPSPSSNSD